MIDDKSPKTSCAGIMNDSSVDESILDLSDADTSCVSSNGGEADPSGLLAMGGAESSLVAQ